MMDLAARLEAEFGAAAVDSCAVPAGAGTALRPRLTVPDADVAAAALRFAARERLRVVPAGAATHLYRAPGAGSADFVLSLGRLDRVLEYEPEDMVAVVQAGVPLAVLDALALPHAQRLGPDPWMDARATVGGAVAANRYGLARRSRGTWRDAVLGARVLHADGRSSKTGGKVVKNVTGFDLAKLYVGSCGTLALLTEINLRLVPRPSTAATVTAVVRPDTVGTLLSALAGADCAPAACTLLQGRFLSAWRELLPPAAHGAAAVCIVLRFEGREASVQPQVHAAVRVTGGVPLDPQPGATLDAALRSACEPGSAGRFWRIRSLPTALAAVLAACGDAWGGDAGVLGFAGVGEVLVHADALPPERAAAWAARVQALGARITVEAGGSAGAIPPAWPDPVAAELWHGIQRALDPDGVFAAGAHRAPGGRA